MNTILWWKSAPVKKLAAAVCIAILGIVSSSCSSEEAENADSPQPPSNTTQESTPTRGLASRNAISAIFSDPFIKIATIQLKSHVQKLQMYDTFNRGKLPAKKCTMQDVEKLTGAIGQTNPKLFIDPWGIPYGYDYHQGTVSSSGPDKVYGPGPNGKTDDLVFTFRK